MRGKRRCGNCAYSTKVTAYSKNRKYFICDRRDCKVKADFPSCKLWKGIKYKRVGFIDTILLELENISWGK